MADGRCPGMSTVDILKATQQGTEPVRCGCRWDVYWRNLANAIEPSVCGGDASVSNYFAHLFILLAAY